MSPRVLDGDPSVEPAFRFGACRNLGAPRAGLRISAAHLYKDVKGVGFAEPALGMVI